MQEESIARILTTAVSIFGILALLRWPYQHLRIDRFRDELFDIRSELFQLAAKGGISFDHPAYGMLRQTINGFIRFGHTLNPLRILAMIVAPDARLDGDFNKEWEEAVKGLDQEVYCSLVALRRRVHKAVAWHLGLSSPGLLLLMFPVVLALGIAALLAGAKYWARSRARSFLTEVDSAALKVGGHSTTPVG